MDQVIADLQSIVAAGAGAIAFFTSWVYMVSKFVLNTIDIPFLPFF